MRYLLVFMLFVGLFVVGKNSFHFGMGIRGKGPVKTESRNVSGFHAIDLNVSAEVEVKISDNYFVEVEAQENLLPILKTEVENGTLKIYFDENVSYSKDSHSRQLAFSTHLPLRGAEHFARWRRFAPKKWIYP